MPDYQPYHRCLGVLLMWVIVTSSTVHGSGCYPQEIVVDNPGFITSPNYPEDYPNNLQCSWHLQASRVDHVINVKVTDANMQIMESNAGRCSADYIQIYDGPSNRSQLVGRWCGLAQPEVRSTGMSLYVEFVTDVTRNFKGFKMEYYTVKAGLAMCQSGKLMELSATDTMQFFTSPNFPNAYPVDVTCKWVLSAPNSSSVVKLEVLESDLEPSTVCSFDVVTVYDSHFSSLNQIGYWCGTSKPTYRSTQMYMNVVFRSDSSTAKTGFRVGYQADRLPAHTLATSIGAIIGSVICGVVLVVVTVVIIVVLCRHGRCANCRQGCSCCRNTAERPEVVVNVNRSDNTVFVMSPVYINGSNSDIASFTAQPPPYPGLDNRGFLYGSMMSLPPAYTETDELASLPRPIQGHVTERRRQLQSASGSSDNVDLPPPYSQHDQSGVSLESSDTAHNEDRDHRSNTRSRVLSSGQTTGRRVPRETTV